MGRNRKRKKKKPGLLGEISHHFPVVAGLVLGGIFLGYLFFTEGGIPSYLKQVHAAEKLERHIAEMQENNEYLVNEIRRVQSDPLKLEELARNRLGMVRKGEKVYQFVEPRLGDSQALP